MIAAAAAWKRGGFEQSCTECRKEGSEEQRKAWGCDAPTEAPQFTLEPCPICRGEDDECPDCGGSGRLDVYRCPFALIEPRHTEICQAVEFLEVGILPGAGGWADQPATFVDALILCQHERASYQEEQKPAK